MGERAIPIACIIAGLLLMICTAFLSGCVSRICLDNPRNMQCMTAEQIDADLHRDDQIKRALELPK